jgi:hypothetical protein
VLRIIRFNFNRCHIITCDVFCSSDDKRLRLSAKETFQLYKGFMGLVEANETARSNVLKPQPGSILGDDIDIFKKPSSRSYVNGSSSSSRLANHSSPDDNRTSAEPSSPFGGGITSFSRDSVVKTTPSSSDIQENGSSSAFRSQGQTSYSSRLTSRPDSAATFGFDTTSYMTSPDQGIGSESEMTNGLTYGATSPFSSLTRPYARYDDNASRSTYDEDSSVPSKYSSRFSSLSRDRSESGSDYPSTRMSAYDKYRSRSPYVTEDRVVASSDYGESGSDYSSTRKSAYDKYRSKSPYVAEDRALSTYDRGETGSDYPSTRSSVYDKYISRSPYAADDRTSSSYSSSRLMTSRNSAPDINSHLSDAAGRPTSRYERILSSRSRSPYRTEDSTAPYLTRAISIEDENNTSRYESTDYSTPTFRPTSSRYTELDGNSPFTTTSEEIRSSLYTNGNGGTSYGLAVGDVTSPETGSYSRSTLSSRLSNLQQTGRSPLTSQDGGSFSSYLSRHTSRLAGNGENDGNAGSEGSWTARLGDLTGGSVSNAGAADESSALLSNRHVAASSWRDVKEEPDSSATVTAPLGRADQLKSSSEFSNGYDVERSQTNGSSSQNDATERVQQFSTATLQESQAKSLTNRTSQDSSDSNHSSPRSDLSSSHRRRMRSDWAKDNSPNNSCEVLKSSSPRIEREKTCDSLTSSDVSREPLSSLAHDDDTWTPVADAISAAMTSLTCASSVDSREPDAAMTPVAETLINSRSETPVSRSDIGSHSSGDFGSTSEVRVMTFNLVSCVEDGVQELHLVLN